MSQDFSDHKTIQASWDSKACSYEKPTNDRIGAELGNYDRKRKLR
jgi:hypothetical protein